MVKSSSTSLSGKYQDKPWLEAHHGLGWAHVYSRSMWDTQTIMPILKKVEHIDLTLRVSYFDENSDKLTC